MKVGWRKKDKFSVSEGGRLLEKQPIQSNTSNLEQNFKQQDAKEIVIKSQILLYVEKDDLEKEKEIIYDKYKQKIYWIYDAIWFKGL